MKKKIIGITMVMAIALASGWNLIEKEKDITLSNMILNNIEALARGESGDCSGGCADIGWGFREIVRCNCETTGYFSSCARWGC